MYNFYVFQVKCKENEKRLQVCFINIRSIIICTKNFSFLQSDIQEEYLHPPRKKHAIVPIHELDHPDFGILKEHFLPWLKKKLGFKESQTEHQSNHENKENNKDVKVKTKGVQCDLWLKRTKHTSTQTVFGSKQHHAQKYLIQKNIKGINPENSCSEVFYTYKNEFKSQLPKFKYPTHHINEKYRHKTSYNLQNGYSPPTIMNKAKIEDNTSLSLSTVSESVSDKVKKESSPSKLSVVKMSDNESYKTSSILPFAHFFTIRKSNFHCKLCNTLIPSVKKAKEHYVFCDSKALKVVVNIERMDDKIFYHYLEKMSVS